MKLSTGRLRVLDFDIENRPLSYLGQDFTTGEVTAIAWRVIGGGWPYECVLLEAWHGIVMRQDMLARFRHAYDQADMVTGHYIRKHDLPVLNGAMLELGFPPLGPKLSSDTKLDLLDSKYVSLSQESLAGMLGVKANKYHMTQPKWREANRLTEEGLALTRKRVVGDVKQHIALRRKLLEQGWLGPPKLWKP